MMPKYSTKWKFVEIWGVTIKQDMKQDMAVAEMFCPMCMRYTTHVFSRGYNNPLEGMNYCPHCGKRMVEDDD